MTHKEKREIIESLPIIGYWSVLGGVEVRKIEYTPDGIMFWVKANAWSSSPTYHIRKVTEQYTVDERHPDNIRVYNQRLYLHDCLRA